jgi:hypothetical protein
MGHAALSHCCTENKQPRKSAERRTLFEFIRLRPAAAEIIKMPASADRVKAAERVATDLFMYTNRIQNILDKFGFFANVVL